MHPLRRLRPDLQNGGGSVPRAGQSGMHPLRRLRESLPVLRSQLRLYPERPRTERKRQPRQDSLTNDAQDNHFVEVEEFNVR